VICKVAKGTKDDVDAAVEAAHVSFVSFNKFSRLLNILIKFKMYYDVMYVPIQGLGDDQHYGWVFPLHPRSCCYSYSYSWHSYIMKTCVKVFGNFFLVF